MIDTILGIINGFVSIVSKVVSFFQQRHDEQTGETRVTEQQESQALTDVARRQEIDQTVAGMSDAELHDGLQQYTKDN